MCIGGDGQQLMDETVAVQCLDNNCFGQITHYYGQ